MADLMHSVLLICTLSYLPTLASFDICRLCLCDWFVCLFVCLFVVRYK